MSKTRELLNFIVFITLYAITIGLFITDQASTLSIGILSLFWAGFVLFRAICVIHTIATLRHIENDTKDKALPWLILNQMRIQSHIKNRFSALQFLNPYFLIWLGLGGIFALWSLITSLAPQDLQQITTAPTAAEIQKTILPLGKVLIIGGIVFTVKSFSYNRTYSTTILSIATAILGLALLVPVLQQNFAARIPGHLQNMWYGWGLGSLDLYQTIYPNLNALSPRAIRIIETGLSGTIFLSLMLGFTGILMIRNIIRHQRRWLFSACGLLVLAILIIADQTLAMKPSINVIWMSGWTLIAALWHRAIYDSKKI